MMGSPPPMLELPTMLHGLAHEVRRKVRVEGQGWAREYLEKGGFTPPQKMLLVSPGELLEVESATVLAREPDRRWRVHLFFDVFTPLSRGVPVELRPRMDEAFESFCLGTPWGTLFHLVYPAAPWSAERMARGFTALLRFWDVLEGPRYARWPNPACTLSDLVRHRYGDLLEAWCPGGATSVREHMTRTVERMARATREDCMEALLRVIPVLIQGEKNLEHRELLRDPGFQRERLAALPSERFERISSASNAVLEQLIGWDRELGRR